VIIFRDIARIFLMVWAYDQHTYDWHHLNLVYFLDFK
jgi:hypothetical protein